MKFGETLLELLRVSAYLTHLISFYVAIRLVICAHKVYKATNKDRTSRLLLFTFSVLMLQSLVNSVVYTAIIFFGLESEITHNFKNLIGQLLILLSLIGFWRMHNGKEF